MATVLVIEDDDSIMMLIKFLIEKDGHFVLQAANAEDGLRIVYDENPDLILMDVQLPGMDGLTATRQLKNDVTTKNIPILVVTASAMKGDEEKVISAGCDDYLIKPIHYTLLLSKVKDMLTGVM